LVNFLLARLHSRDHSVIRYDIGQGIRFVHKRDRSQCRKAFALEHKIGTGKDGERGGEKLFDQLVNQSRSDHGIALQLLSELTRLEIPRPVSVLIEYSELLFPAGEPSQLSDQDRRRLALVRDWLSDPRFHAHRGAVFLIAETAASVHQHIRSLPLMMHVDIPLPDRAERLSYMQWMDKQGEELALGDNAKSLADFTAGMTLGDIRSLFLDAQWAGKELNSEDILEEVNRIIAARIGSHIEIMEPPHSLDDVIGQRALKLELDKQRRLMDMDDANLSPVGILVAGANGTGKTFLYSAWAASCNRLVVVLKNLRGSYFGETERIFEQVKSVLEALGKVIVLIDEADTQFGKPGNDTHETEARLFGALIRMMGDPQNRGRIVWVLMTARPERLAPDLKRNGRAGLHLPIFDPEGEDREDFITYTLAGIGLDRSQLDAACEDLLQQRCKDFAPADFKELASQLQAACALGDAADSTTLSQILDDLRPVDLANERYRQTLQALLHCSRNNIIPPSLKNLDRESIDAHLAGGFGA
ncbi:MAG: AAA family ATPase, partial [Planctomycetes bacterium]|nr:AAA family ATPase [Planctomycetota bacterium]